MTVEQKLSVVEQKISTEHATVRWWFHSIHRYPTGLIRGLPHCPALGADAPGMICEHAQQLVQALHLKARLVRLMIPRVGHLALWLCIHGGEGAWYDNTGNGYYNGLQMTWGWGPLPDSGPGADPNHYTPTEIMSIADGAYREHGYSRSWLSGQWPQTVQSCWRYAV